LKIRKPTPSQRPKVYALLRNAFKQSVYEARLIEQLHQNDKTLQLN